MIQVLLASLLLSVIHASIPNHWLPLIAVGREEKWTHSETMFGTVITGFAHTLSTVIIGIIVGVIGYKLSSSYGMISGIIAPVILGVLGIIYILRDLLGAKHSHDHFSLNKLKEREELIAPGKNHNRKWVVLSTLSLGMFLTPCVEIEAYYFQASTFGWMGIWIVSAVYTFITVGSMMLLVYFGMKGVKRFRSHFLEEHSKRITGIVLIAVGLITYFIKF